jgi:hypothetical protein
MSITVATACAAIDRIADHVAPRAAKWTGAINRKLRASAAMRQRLGDSKSNTSGQAARAVFDQARFASVDRRHSRAVQAVTSTSRVFDVSEPSRITVAPTRPSP